MPSGTVSNGLGNALPYSYAYVNAAARTGDSGFVSADVGKFALQLDTGTLWRLSATTPTWQQVGVSAGVNKLFWLDKNGTGQSVPGQFGPAAKVTWGRAYSDTAGITDTTNSKVTPGEVGFYEFLISIGFTPATGSLASIQLYLYRNGTLYQQLYDDVAGDTQLRTFNLKALVEVASITDYFELYWNSSYNTPTIDGDVKRTYWKGYKLG